MKIKPLRRYRGLLLAMGPALAFGAPAPASNGIVTMNYFLGTWDCAGKFPSTGKAIASTIRFNRDSSVKAIVKRHDDRPPSPYHAMELWVYQPTTAAFSAAIADNFGGVREFHSTGWQGDELTWQSASGVSPIQRFVYHRIDAGTFRLDWDVSQDGSQYVVGDTLTCKRPPGSGSR